MNKTYYPKVNQTNPLSYVYLQLNFADRKKMIRFVPYPARFEI
jgi:hypothetical protein